MKKSSLFHVLNLLINIFRETPFSLAGITMGSWNPFGHISQTFSSKSCVSNVFDQESFLELLTTLYSTKLFWHIFINLLIKALYNTHHAPILSPFYFGIDLFPGSGIFIPKSIRQNLSHDTYITPVSWNLEPFLISEYHSVLVIFFWRFWI